MKDEYVKTQYVEAPDVEHTKRGFMDVKIKQEYDGRRLDYDTTFLSKTVSDKNNAEVMINPFGINLDDMG